MLIGVDTLLGGNIASSTGENHVIADQWPPEEPLPGIYSDPLSAQLRAKGGAYFSPKEGSRLVRKYSLLDLPSHVSILAQNFSPDRAGVIARMMESLRLILRKIYGDITKQKCPSYDELYYSATGLSPELYDLGEALERLRSGLAILGEEVSTSRSLRETYEGWRQKNLIPPAQLAARMPEITAELLTLTRQNILRRVKLVIPGFDTCLENVSFDGQEFKPVNGVYFAGASSYLGGENSFGKPMLKALLEYNTDHPLTETEVLHFLAHEGIPGHYFRSAIADLRRRAGQLGFEACALAMCTGITVLEEGWAQAAFQMLYGGTRQAVIDLLGPEWTVQFAAEDLGDIAKHNASIHHQRDGMSIEELRLALARDYALPLSKIEGISGEWAKHPILGPTYGPAYFIGNRVLEAALSERKFEDVVDVCLYTHGLVDLHRFRALMLDKNYVLA